jgi:hypothetical protein
VHTSARLGIPAITVVGSTGCLGRVAEWQTRWLQVPVSFGTWGFKSPFAHKIDLSPHLLAEVYLLCDLAATVTKNAHHRDGVCGHRRSHDGNMRRLLPRTAGGLDAVNLEEANQPDRARETGDQPACACGCAPHPPALPGQADCAPVGSETHCAR